MVTKTKVKTDFLWNFFSKFILSELTLRKVITLSSLKIREEILNNIPDDIKREIECFLRRFYRKIKKARSFEDILPLVLKNFNFNHILRISEILNLSIPAAYAFIAIYLMQLSKEMKFK